MRPPFDIHDARCSWPARGNLAHGVVHFSDTLNVERLEIETFVKQRQSDRTIATTFNSMRKPLSALNLHIRRAACLPAFARPARDVLYTELHSFQGGRVRPTNCEAPLPGEEAGDVTFVSPHSHMEEDQYDHVS